MVKVANKKVKLQISASSRKYLPKLANKLENSQISVWKFLLPVKKIPSQTDNALTKHSLLRNVDKTSTLSVILIEVI